MYLAKAYVNFRLQLYLQKHICGIGNDADNYVDGIHNLSATLKLISRKIKNPNNIRKIWNISRLHRTLCDRLCEKEEADQEMAFTVLY
jgi:hypothetical protein